MPRLPLVRIVEFTTDIIIGVEPNFKFPNQIGSENWMKLRDK